MSKTNISHELELTVIIKKDTILSLTACNALYMEVSFKVKLRNKLYSICIDRAKKCYPALDPKNLRRALRCSLYRLSVITNALLSCCSK